MQKYDYFLAPEQLTSYTDVIIRNVGFSQCPPNYTYGWDTRDYYLIHYCLSGHGIYYAGNREYEIGPQDGFLITPGSTIKHLSDPKDPWNLCWVGFRGERIAYYLQKARLDREHLIFRYTRDNLIESCIENIYDRARCPEVSCLTLTGYLYVLLGALADQNSEETGAPVTLNHFEKAVRYIRHNIRSPITVEQLAEQHNVAVSQLYRSFMKHSGMSPKQYLDREKMAKACELIRKTDLSMHEIANYLGYEYDTHFYKTFHRVMGEKPSEYAAKLNRESSAGTSAGNFP